MAENTKELKTKVAVQARAMVPEKISEDVKAWYFANKSRLTALVGGDQNKVALYIAAAFAQINKIPLLIEADPKTLHQCMIYSMSMNLLPGIMGECWFLPFKVNGIYEATFIPGYQGLVKLAYNSGFVRRISGHIVWSKDEFDYNPAREEIFHVPFKGPEAERGERVWCYSAIKNCFGEECYSVKSAEFVEGIKRRSKASSSSFSPWNSKYSSDVDAMYLKTVFKQNVKWIPKSTNRESFQLGKAIELDNRADIGESQEQILLPDELGDVQQLLLEGQKND